MYMSCGEHISLNSAIKNIAKLIISKELKAYETKLQKDSRITQTLELCYSKFVLVWACLIYSTVNVNPLSCEY